MKAISVSHKPDGLSRLPAAVAARLRPYIHALVRAIQPSQLILFGSQACGRATADSDFDLLFIRSDHRSPKAGNMQARRVISTVAAAPESFTLLTKTPGEIEEKLRQRSPLYCDIMDQGLVLYAEKTNIRD